MKRNNIIEYISALFILLFVYTATSKLFELPAFRYVLSTSPLIGNYASMIGWALPVVELIIAVLLIIPYTRKAGLWFSFLLMIVFTGYVSYMLTYTTHLPCQCGGVFKQMTWNQHLIFNVFFTLLALCGIWLNWKSPVPNKQQLRTGYSM